jgi:hypothetical protein
MAISVEYLVVGGGGGGGRYGGGGGGGGYLTGTASLQADTNYTITVGSGGLGWVGDAQSGGNAANGTNSSIIPTSLGTPYSYFFNGSNYLTLPAGTPFAFGAGNFTIEAWVNMNSFANSGGFAQTIIDFRPANTNGFYPSLFVNSSGSPYFTTNNTQVLVPSATLTLNTWNHVALVKNGSITTLYYNGISVGTYTDTNTYLVGAASPTIGVNGYTRTIGYFSGSISNLRIVKGTAVYTANFTVPTIPLTAITNTSLLTCRSSTIIDTSTNAFALTNTGTVTAITQNPFSYIAVGGGGAGVYGNPIGSTGATGGSGGGAGNSNSATALAGGFSLYSQGNAGGGTSLAYTAPQGAGGGGGAGGAGASGASGGKGGIGLSNSISGTATYYAGGGSGCQVTSNLSGGLGGGGTGYYAGVTGNTDIDAVANTGGGGGGGRDNLVSGVSRAGNGGSGIVIIRYLNNTVSSTGDGITTPSGSYTVRTFTTNGTVTFSEYTPGQPVYSVAPVISGTVGTIGNTFTCTQGTWTGDATISYAYQWYRSGTAINGATTNTYTLNSLDSNTTLTCIVSATNSVKTLPATSNAIFIWFNGYLSLQLDTYSYTVNSQISAIDAILSDLSESQTAEIDSSSTTPISTTSQNTTVNSAVNPQLTYSLTDNVAINTAGGTTVTTQSWYIS